MRWVIILLVGVGCHGGNPVEGPDGGGGQALHLAWASKPGVPGTAGNVTIERAAFSAKSLRIVGDAGPGDPRTAVDRLALEWSTAIAPVTQDFPEAPIGLYSRVVLELETADDLRAAIPGSYEIEGTVKISGNPVGFQILDVLELPVSFELDHGVSLEPNQEATVFVSVDLDSVVNSIDFSALPLVQGKRVLVTGDPQFLEVRTKVQEAFHGNDSATRD